jgi:hypothetical protein
MLVGLTLMLALGSVDAQPTPPAPPEKPKLICREQEQSVGTHIRSGRRCRTAEQWEIEDSGKGQPLPPTARVTSNQGDGLPQAKRPQR